MENFLQNSQQALSPYECEKLIENISLLSLEQFGTEKWLQQNTLWSKLNLQAHLNAAQNKDEFVMDYLSTFDKMKILITELIQNEIWKAQILPAIKKQVLQSGIRSYLSNFHEAVLINLIEVVMYHQTAWDALENSSIDLIEYVYSKLSLLVQKQNYPSQKELMQRKNDEEEFDKNSRKINFEIQMSCLSILRYCSDYLKNLNIGLSSYLMKEKDVMTILIQLLEIRPWQKQEDGKTFFWVDKEFKEINESYFLCKEEGQIWLTIYNLLYTEQTSQIYEINDYRKNNLLRIKKYLNDIILDQIPVLTQLKKTLEELSLMNVSQNFKNNPFIIQTIPQIKNSILKSIDLQKVIEKQKLIFSQNFDQNEKQILDQLSDVFTGFQEVKQERAQNYCAFCSKLADKKCSRCKKVFYCSRTCQVSHYKTVHKKVCKKISGDTNQQIKQLKKTNIKKVDQTQTPKTEILDYEELNQIIHLAQFSKTQKVFQFTNLFWVNFSLKINFFQPDLINNFYTIKMNIESRENFFQQIDLEKLKFDKIIQREMLAFVQQFFQDIDLFQRDKNKIKKVGFQKFQLKYKQSKNSIQTKGQLKIQTTIENSFKAILQFHKINFSLENRNFFDWFNSSFFYFSKDQKYVYIVFKDGKENNSQYKIYQLKIVLQNFIAVTIFQKSYIS